MDFSVGGTKSRKGTRGVYSFSGNTVVHAGTNATSTDWANPANAVSTTVYASGTGTFVGELDVTQFAFNESRPILGIKVTFNGNMLYSQATLRLR